MEHSSGPDGIHCFVIIPNTTLVQFNHDIERSLRSILIGILQKPKDKVLEFLVDMDILLVLVQLFEVTYDHSMEELPQLLIFAPK